jgi:hypothetical protein
MNNSERYHFQDFTLDHYRELLTSMAEGYVFRGYTDFKEDESFCILRHDIDLSLKAALEVAHIEKEMGIQSTYFLHFHNEWYNLMEASSRRLVEQIQGLGHHVALHFDALYYTLDSAEEFEQHLAQEKQWMAQLFHVTPKVFSFHNPMGFTLTLEDASYQGMVNTYSSYFKTQVGYCSDSNGIWRHRRMADFLAAREDPRIQILTHPGWWTKEPDSPKSKVERITRERAAETIRYYTELLETCERPNIDWE